MKVLLPAMLLVAATLPAQAQDPAVPRDAQDAPVFDRMFDSLLSAAAAGLQEYVELDSSITGGGPTAPPTRNFTFKLYPQGKSRSRDHFTAEGSFSLEPDHPRSEFHFRFRDEPVPRDQPTPSDGESI